jgi:hypothetical protein
MIGIRVATIALVIAASAAAGALAQDNDETVGLAAAPTRLELSPGQRSAIFNAVQGERRKIVLEPSLLHASVGAQVPPSIELHVLPELALAQAPAAATVRYTVMQNQVLLVDPNTLRVLDVIDR